MVYKELHISDLDDVNDRPLYILVAGAAGVGKSTIFKKYCTNFPIMDVDDIIAELGDGVYDRTNVPEAIEIITKRVFHMMESQESFVAMGVSSVLRVAIERLTNAKEMGYYTVLVHIHAPLQQIIDQNRERIDQGKRGVILEEEHRIEEMFEGSNQTAKYLKESDLLDYLIEYDNTRNI